MNKYNVTYITGSGNEHGDGVWTVTRTRKRIFAENIAHYMSGVYSMHEVGEKIRIGAGTGNPIKYEESDGSFVVYFKQAGTPYVFVLARNSV